MEADTIALWGLVVTTLGTVFAAYFKSSLSTIKTTVKHQGEQIERLETANTELKKENKSLRVKIEDQAKEIKELYSRLINGKKDSGIF